MKKRYAIWFVIFTLGVSVGDNNRSIACIVPT